MSNRFRLTLAQLNPTVGAIEANADKAFAAWEAGRAAGADMVALPEMFITGYHAQDLVMKPALSAARDARRSKCWRSDCADGPALGIGGPYARRAGLYNAYYVLRGRRDPGAGAQAPPAQRNGVRRGAPVQRRPT